MVIAWLVTSTPVGLGPIALAAGAVFSGSMEVSILLLILLTMASYLISSRQGKRSNAVLSQMNFSLRCFFLFVSLFGVALQGSPLSSLLIFIGLVLSLPTVLWSLIFERQEHGVTQRTYLYSSLLPALATLNVLMRIKPEMRVEWTQTWDLVLTILGLSTFLAGSWLSLMKRKSRSKWIHLTQAWLGLSMFVLMVDSESLVRLAIASLSVVMMTSPILISLGQQLGRKTEVFSRVFLAGMPGFLVCSGLFYSLKSIVALNVNWIWVLIVAFTLQAFALNVGHEFREREPNSSVRFRYYIVVATQLFCAVAFFWLERVGHL